MLMAMSSGLPVTLGRCWNISEWRSFAGVIDKAKTACRMSGQRPACYFGDVNKMVGIGSGAQRHIDDVRLSRYACYLIVQNGDPANRQLPRGERKSFAQNVDKRTL